jgi:hypothetical protein
MMQVTFACDRSVVPKVDHDAPFRGARALVAVSRVAILKEVVLLLSHSIARRSLLFPKSFNHDRLLLAQSVIFHLQSNDLLLQFRDTLLQSNNFWAVIWCNFRQGETYSAFFSSVPLLHFALAIFEALHRVTPI